MKPSQSVPRSGKKRAMLLAGWRRLAPGGFTVAAVTALLVAAHLWGQSITWDSLKTAIRAFFPSVTQITVEELVSWLATPERRSPLLLDARAPEEFDVSHLEDAVLTPTLADALAALQRIPKDRPLVVYCSVGWRSSALAEQVQERGFTTVFNLEGSIFEWANQGHPVYRDARRVRAVHPYDSTWGALLNEDLRSTVPVPAR